MIINRIKRNLRFVQERLERGLIGSKLQKLMWRNRHLYNREWALGYLQTVEHPHRAQVVEAVLSFDPVESILEIGCASGANLIRLRRASPNTKLNGIDINRKAIEVGRHYFEQRKDKNTCLSIGPIEDLSRFENSSVDVVLSDAVLMFIAPNDILGVLAELCRVARKGIVLNEYQYTGFKTEHFDGGRWAYDFPRLINSVRPTAIATVQKSAFRGGIWDVYGALISVRL